LVELCQENNLLLKIKNKGADSGLQETEEEMCPHPHRWGTVERVKSFKFLDVHITEDLQWSHHTDSTSGSCRNVAWPIRKLQTSIDAPLRAFCQAASSPGTATARP
jgi:hypothetical protein